MRFRTGLVIGGVIGYLVARRLGERDPEDARPPGIRLAMARHPSTSRLASHGRRLAERATWKSAEAIQRARANVQRRMEPDVDDLPLN
ncbi:MAG TPA: hypothetical protein VFK59_11280 [Actinomycetota bacterium]|jgi:hypothetical protein|nr:hypothetical protein [Actinomycetota bacterium]